MRTATYGIGISTCPARGHINWGSRVDFDAVEFFMILFLPVIPCRAIHEFDWDGTQSHSIRIRWSFGLVFRAYLHRWLFVPGVAAILTGMIGYDAWQRPSGYSALTWAMVTMVLASTGPIGWYSLRKTDRRTRAIRWILGPHDLGSSDMATWTRDLLQHVSDPQPAFESTSFAQAARREIESGSPIKAMWAARFCVALEDRHDGEHLTDEILAKPGITAAIAATEKDPQNWPQAIVDAA